MPFTQCVQQHKSNSDQRSSTKTTCKFAGCKSLPETTQASSMQHFLPQCPTVGPLQVCGTLARMHTGTHVPCIAPNLKPYLGPTSLPHQTPYMRLPVTCTHHPAHTSFPQLSHTYNSQHEACCQPVRCRCCPGPTGDRCCGTGCAFARHRRQGVRRSNCA
jgi:hypothetical protein